MRDALSAVSGPNADAPDGPHVEVVDVRDLPVAREGRLRAPRDCGPADDLVTVVREHADRSALHQLGNLLRPVGAAERQILLRRYAIAQAPADVRVGSLRTQHRRDVLEDGGGSYLDRHDAACFLVTNGRGDSKASASRSSMADFVRWRNGSRRITRSARSVRVSVRMPSIHFRLDSRIS